MGRRRLGDASCYPHGLLFISSLTVFFYRAVVCICVCLFAGFGYQPLRLTFLSSVYSPIDMVFLDLILISHTFGYHFTCFPFLLLSAFPFLT